MGTRKYPFSQSWSYAPVEAKEMQMKILGEAFFLKNAKSHKWKPSTLPTTVLLLAFPSF
jgi:hypothetical protein